jgi:hypothetical protein
MNIGDFFIGLINSAIDGLCDAGETLIGLLPVSPFQALSNSDVSGYISGLNWIIPIGTMLSIVQAWALAIGLYYVVAVALRWLKAIE